MHTVYERRSSSCFGVYLFTFLDGTEQNWTFMDIYGKNGQKWQFFEICDKIKGIKGEITT